MLHVARWISKILFVVIVGCETFDKAAPDPGKPLPKPPAQEVFYYPFDQVWRAAHAVLRYPIANENPDSGYIETEYIKGVDGFLPPEKTKPPSAGIRYKLILVFAKGSMEGRESTRITIDKKMEILRDFFSEPESTISDGLEEKVILYRIERELVIFNTLKKVAN